MKIIKLDENILLEAPNGNRNSYVLSNRKKHQAKIIQTLADKATREQAEKERLAKEAAAKKAEEEKENKLNKLISNSDKEVKDDNRDIGKNIYNKIKNKDASLKLSTVIDKLNKIKKAGHSDLEDWVDIGTDRLEVITGNGKRVKDMLGDTIFGKWFRDAFKPDQAIDPNNRFNTMLKNIPEQWFKDKNHLNVKNYLNLYNLYARALQRSDGDSTIKKLSSLNNLKDITERGNLFNQAKGSIDYIVKEYVNSTLDEKTKNKVFFDSNGNFRDRQVIQRVLDKISANNDKK